MFARGKEYEVRNTHVAAFLREKISTSYIEIVVAAADDEWFVLALKLVYAVDGALLCKSLNFVANYIRKPVLALVFQWCKFKVEHAAHAACRLEFVGIVNEKVHCSVATHTQAGDEGFLWGEVEFLLHHWEKFALEEGSPLHLFRVGVVEVPAVVETIRANDSEVCPVADFLDVMFVAPILVASAPSV